ncbi:MAG: hypothetical protein ACOC5G_02545 [Acidobacteriota bacterium]
MKIEKQLTVTTPNEPGILGRVLGTLANAGVNLKAVWAHSEKDKGIFHLITSGYEKAKKCLEEIGYEVKIMDVVTVLMDDRIGAGAEIGALLGNAVIDIDYCYGSTAGLGKALLVFKTTNNKKALETLE